MPLNNLCRVMIVMATALFGLWTLLMTVFWPLEDYANVQLALAESTNQITRGMSIGFAAYVASLVMILVAFSGQPNRPRT